MFESGYYPAGAENDPRAPWNQTSLEDEWGDEADRALEEELEGEEFTDWLLDHEYIEDEHGVSAVKNTALWKTWQDLYCKDRRDDLLQELADEYEGRMEYEREQAAEEAAEAARERMYE